MNRSELSPCFRCGCETNITETTEMFGGNYYLRFDITCPKCGKIWHIKSIIEPDMIDGLDNTFADISEALNEHAVMRYNEFYNNQNITSNHKD